MFDGAARLGAATSVLGLAEGLETALSVAELFRLPCWATLGVERFARIAIPPHVERLHLFADPDAMSLARAEHAARTFRRHVGRVEVHMPDGNGDYNDILRGIKTQAA